MFNTNFTKYSEFKYWFIRNADKTFTVFEKLSGSEICTIEDESATVIKFFDKEVETAEITEDFNKFKTRPEYPVGCMNCESLVNQADVADAYDTMLVGCALIRARRNGADDPDTVIDRAIRTVNWLHSTDFYKCPASSIYHESYEGGLLVHTMNVVSAISEICSCKVFSEIQIDRAVLVALVHDWCKIGNYESYMRNVKNEETGKWEQKQAYRRTGEPNPIGHGALSMYYASRCFNLSVDEAAAIRWHMGRFRCCDDEINDLQSANEKYPLVHLLQFADQLAITSYFHI